MPPNQDFLGMVLLGFEAEGDRIGECQLEVLGAVEAAEFLRYRLHHSFKLYNNQRY